MGRKGLFIDYEYCTGCHACEMACQMEHGLPVGRYGIKVAEIGPWQIEGDKWQYDFVPIPTDECDLCAERVAAGKKPTCVHHCQAAVMKYGDIEELQASMNEKRKVVTFVLE